MRAENELILITSALKRSEEETKRIEELLLQPIDWGYVIGQLIHHRMTGYFVKGLPENCNRFLFKEVKKQLDLIVKLNKVMTRETMDFMQNIFDKFEEQNVRYAGLKGAIFNASLYELGTRRSNDIDILVPESDLKTVDTILREEGFIQALNSGKGEASKKDKIIQRLHHHDLIPYYKKNGDNELLPYLKIDINFRIDDSKDKEKLTDQVLDYGTTLYDQNGYNIRGLRWETHLLHLCIHFWREASHSLWVSDKRDCSIYKLVDIENTIRAIGFDKLEEWVKTVEQFDCGKEIYFTLFYLNQFYPNKIYESLIEKLSAYKDCVDKIAILGTDDIVQRKRNYVDSAFDLKYSIDFSEADYKKVDIQ